MIKLKQLVNEIVPYEKDNQIKTGLVKKYGPDELESYTFGIELEYEPGSVDNIDFDRVRLELINDVKIHTKYEDWLNDQRNRVNKRTYSVDRWDDSYGPIDPDSFDNIVSEPERRDFDTNDEFDEAHNKWENDRYNVESEYKHFLRRNFEDYIEEFITDLIDSGEWREYVYDESVYYVENIEESIKEAIFYIEKSMQQKVQLGNGTMDTWGVGQDGSNIEIRSKHLNQSEFNLVREICDYVRDKKVSGNTSAHVHIGLPDDFDAFDLLAITTLVDEKAIQKDIGPDRNLTAWAKLRNSLHNIIVTKLIETPSNQSTKEKTFKLTNEQLYKLLSNIERHHGTNVSSMDKNKTIEFRYLSSQVTKSPQTFINWIKYYLLLVKIAKSRNRVTLKRLGTDSQIITAVRETNGVKFVLNDKTSTPNLPTALLKKGKVSDLSSKITQGKK